MRKEKSGTTLVTPEMAKEWLTHNIHNRAVSRAIVEKYARDMKAGKFIRSKDYRLKESYD